MLSRGAGGGDAEVGLGLGEVEDLGAVREDRGRGFAGVEATPVYLADVSDEVGLVATGPTEKIRQATEEIVVGERRQRVSAFHDDNIGRRFATSWVASGARRAANPRPKRVGGTAKLVGALRAVRASCARRQRRLAKGLRKLVKGKVKKLEGGGRLFGGSSGSKARRRSRSADRVLRTWTAGELQAITSRPLPPSARRGVGLRADSLNLRDRPATLRHAPVAAMTSLSARFLALAFVGLGCVTPAGAALSSGEVHVWETQEITLPVGEELRQPLRGRGLLDRARGPGLRPPRVRLLGRRAHVQGPVRGDGAGRVALAVGLESA